MGIELATNTSICNSHGLRITGELGKRRFMGRLLIFSTFLDDGVSIMGIACVDVILSFVEDLMMCRKLHL